MRPVRVLSRLFACAVFCDGAAFLIAQQTPAPAPSPPPESAEEAIELSPFFVAEKPNQGYYASQTLGGGRLRQEIKDLGSSIQVVTREFLDDLSITGVEELMQYTTGTEVGGILGNYTGFSGGADNETSTGNARRNPDGTSRIRGLAAPDRARIFFSPTSPSTATTPTASTSTAAPIRFSSASAPPPASPTRACRARASATKTSLAPASAAAARSRPPAPR